MPTFHGATFPATGWLPNPDQLNDVGEAILDVVLGGLEQMTSTTLYERVFVGHGSEAPVDPSRRRQISVVCSRVAIGRAGEEQFQFAGGDIGAMAFQTARFQVEISQPYPMHQGNSGIDVTKIAEVRDALWRDGLVVWGSLLALTMGGVTHPNLPPCNNLLLGALEPRNPSGGEASWVTTLSVQL